MKGGNLQPKIQVLGHHHRNEDITCFHNPNGHPCGNNYYKTNDTQYGSCHTRTCEDPNAGKLNSLRSKALFSREFVSTLFWFSWKEGWGFWLPRASSSMLGISKRIEEEFQTPSRWLDRLHIYPPEQQPRTQARPSPQE